MVLERYFTKCLKQILLQCGIAFQCVCASGDEGEVSLCRVAPPDGSAPADLYNSRRLLALCPCLGLPAAIS